MRRRWLLVAALILLFALAGAGFATTLVPTATATASLVVQDPRDNALFGTGSTSGNYVANQVAILQLPSTLQVAETVLREEHSTQLSWRELEDRLSVEQPGDSNLIRISFDHEDPRIARDAVNAVVTAYETVLAQSAAREREQQLRRINAAIAELEFQIARAPVASTTTLRPTLDQLLARRAELAVEAGAGSGVAVPSPATLPRPERAISPLAGGLIGGLLGSIPAAGAAYVVAVFRRRFSDRYEPEAVIGAPLLSEVPDFRSERLISDVPSLDAGRSASAEAFRFATTMLSVRQGDATSTSHAIVSAGSQEGKTTVTANLAVTAGDTGRRVLAIDGDLDGRGLSFLLLGDRRGGPGLVEVLEGTAQLEQVIETVKLSAGRSIELLRGGGELGTEGVRELFASPRMRAFMTEVQRRYDLVLVDVPPVLQVAYASSLVRATDAAVMVVPHGAPVGPVEDLSERLDLLGSRVVGYVYNRAPLRAGLGQLSRLVEDERRRPAAES